MRFFSMNEHKKKTTISEDKSNAKRQRGFDPSFFCMRFGDMQNRYKVR